MAARSPRDMPKVRGLSAGYALFHYLYSRWYYKKAIRDNESAPDKPEIIGVRNAKGRYKLESKVYTGWTNTLDTTSRPGHVQITLANASGGADKLLAYSIYGNPVLRFGGNLGYKHDSFNDYDDIIKNGERVFEFGNNFVVTKTQLENLADYYWKLMRRKKHMYVITLSGTRYWFEPGEWYTLEIGGAGQVEYIDSIVECYDVQTERGADGVGQTVIAFREVEQNWVFDSNAVARFIACGSPQAIPKTEGVVSVASSDYMGAADYYCDGTSDEDEINAAISSANASGRGVVCLLGETFNIDGTVNMLSDVILDMNGSTLSLEASMINAILFYNAGFTVETSGVAHGTIQGPGVDTESLGALIYVRDAENISIVNMKLLDGRDGGITLDGDNGTVTNISISESTIKDCFGSGLLMYGTDCAGLRFINNYVINCFHGVQITTGAKDIQVTANYIENCNVTGISGITSSEDISISANRIIECGWHRRLTTAYSGIYIDNANCKNSLITTNHVTRCGNLISYYDCEHATNPPQLDGNLATNTTATRSDVEAYAGTYSYKINKDNAAGTAAFYYFTDNADALDMHGFVAGVTYKISMRVFIPAGAMTGTEMQIDFSDGVIQTEQAAANTYDEFQEVTLTKTLDAAATRAWCRVSFQSTAALNEFFYIDNVRVVPMGLGNDHSTNFSDSGTGTVVSGNSWQ